MKIGVLSKNYAARRLFLDKIDGAEYRDLRFNNSYLWRNAHLFFLRAMGKLNMSPEEAAAKLFYDYKSVFPTGCDVLHFFNTICHDRHTPWVISIESAVPWPLSVTRCVETPEPDFSSLRNDGYVRKALDDLVSDNCLALMPLSKCSSNIQEALVGQFPDYGRVIAEKLVTLYPPQEFADRRCREKDLTYSDDETFTFFYVGKNYFRKGGRDTVEVLARLRKKYDFKLVLISALVRDERKYERTDNDLHEARQLIESNGDWIEYHEGLPNSMVLEKLKRAHVALLPTWMDTFAYSVLESQACGTPVISTSLRALTEINSNDVGWLIDVPVNRLNNPILRGKKDFKAFEEMLQAGLEEKIVYVLEHRQEVRLKAERCLERIVRMHSPAAYADCLSLLYQGKVEEARKMIGKDTDMSGTETLNNLTGGGKTNNISMRFAPE